MRPESVNADEEATVGSLEECEGLAADRFLYHGAPMVLLRDVVEVGPESVRCTCISDRENPFFVPGRGVPGWVSVEFMAQCIAVGAGARAAINGRPIPIGLLLGTMALECRVSAFEPGVSYQAACLSIFDDGHGMGSYDCVIERDGETMARARLTVKQLSEDPGSDA